MEDFPVAMQKIIKPDVLHSWDIAKIKNNLMTLPCIGLFFILSINH